MKSLLLYFSSKKIIKERLYQRKMHFYKLKKYIDCVVKPWMFILFKYSSEGILSHNENQNFIPFCLF